MSGNFVLALQGKCALQLSGLGDPSCRGEAFSFLKQPQKVPIVPAPLFARCIDSLSPKVVNSETRQLREIGPKAEDHITGQEGKDLRKSTLVELGEILKMLGVDDATIASLPRWKRYFYHGFSISVDTS